MNNRRLVGVNTIRTAVTLTIVSFIVSIPLVGIMEFFRHFDTRPIQHVGTDWFILALIVALFTLASFVISFFGALAFNMVCRFTGGVPYRSEIDPDPTYPYSRGVRHD
jgi:hypothetical protein